MTRDKIKQILLANGFTIKPGLDDLKPYVYEAVEAVLEAALAPVDFGVDMASGDDWSAVRLCLCECPERGFGMHRLTCPALLRGWRCDWCNNILYNDWVEIRGGRFCNTTCSHKWRVDNGQAHG